MKCFFAQTLFLLLFWGAYGCVLPASAQTRIFNSSPSAQPGEAVSLQGNFGAAAKIYVAAAAGTTALPVLVQSAGQATVQVPSTLALDMYQIWVEDQGQRSPSVYVNRARGMHFDSPEVGPGGPLRLFGRNLQLSGSAAQVRFQARNGGSGSGAAVVQASQSDAYTLRLTAPTSLTPGVVYDVYVSNGRGGSAGETLVERPVTAIAAGGDYFQLGVGWAAKLTFTGNVYNVKTDARLPLKAVGNGTADDRPAIQAAIERAAAAGGGVVYLPAGTYKLLYSGWGGLVMRNRVVVQGAGKASTFIKFGYDAPAGYSGAGQGVHFDDRSYQSGFADLALLNIDTTGKWMINLWADKGTELFLQRVRFDLNVGEWLMLQNNSKLLIANSDITQGINRSAYRGPILLLGCTNLVMSRNSITFATSGLDLGHVQDAVFEENRIYRDGSARYPVGLVNHVLILGFTQNVVVKGNLFKLINGPAQNSNDGEAIIAEGGGSDRIDEDAGTVSAATATTLQDNSKNWGAMRQQPVVAIVHGPGMGQWRAISRRSGNTLTLSQAWDVVPTAASRYAIFNWGSRSWLLQGNTLEGHQRGVTLYGNATLDVAIVGNTLTNSGSIDLTPWQANQAHLGVPQEFLPMYNNQIVGNTVANTNGANGVFIGVHTVQYLQARTFGTSVIGLEVRRNSLTAGKPNTPALVDAAYPEGYLNLLHFQQGSETYVEEQEPAILGSIFQDNTAINCESALHLNSGSYNTLVCNTTLANAGAGGLVEDIRLGGLNHSSVGTAACLQTSTAGLRTPENPASVATGLNYKYYEGYWDYLPDLTSLPTIKTGLTTGFELSMRQRDYGYAVSYSGYVTVPADGQYSFILNSDDGSRLYIGSTLVVDNNQQGEHERTGSIGLRAGTHALTVTFLQRGGAQLLAVSYLGPGIPKQPVPVSILRRPSLIPGLRVPENPAGAVAGLNYQYYEGSWSQVPDFNALKPVKTGVTAAIDLNARTRDDYFASRFTGYVDVPTDGEYTFYTSSDDGSQLFIGSTLVVDNNGLHGAQERAGKISLQRGKHALTVTFLEGTGGQLLTASYEGPGVGKKPLPASALYRVDPVAGTPANSAASFYRAINLNGPALTLDGNAWDGSTAANVSYSGNTAANQAVPLVPATDATRASMIRSMLWGGATSVTLNAVPSGTYDVYLYVWEDNYPETFSVQLQNTTVLSNYNSGSAGTWKKLGPWRTTSTNGALSLTTQGGAANISGLEVWRAASAAASATKTLNSLNATAATSSLSAPPTLSTTNKLQLHPNPSASQVFLETDTNDWSRAVVRDSYGRVCLSQERQQESTALDVSALPTGIYLVEVRSAAGQILRSKLTVAH